MARSLEAGGFSREQSESIAISVSGAIGDAAATKADLAEVRNELKADIAEVRNELKADIAEVRSELAETRRSLDAKIDGVRGELKTDTASLRLWVLQLIIGQFIATVAVLGGLMRVLN